MSFTRLASVPILVGTLLALAGSAGAADGPPDTIRIGGPSAPSESKIAIVGTDSSLGKRFLVRDASGKVVLRGKLRGAAGKSAPWRRAYTANLSQVSAPGSYRVEVGKLRSRPWVVADGGSRSALRAILDYFAANRDGDEPSPIHGPAHLNDAVIHPDSPVAAGAEIDLTGGWMDAGDMIHFTETTAFAAAMLEASARLDPGDAARLEAEADVGARWLLKAHPSNGVFIAQLGDDRDHEVGFRDPTEDDSSAEPGIGTRYAYPEIGGDLGGKAAAALALAYVRTGDPRMLASAREWYAAGLAAARPARALKDAGYPAVAGEFYVAPNWKDSMAAGAAELYRGTCAAGFCIESYQDEFIRFATDEQSGAYAAMGAVDDFASFGAAEVCGAFGDPGPFSPEAQTVGCDLLAENGRIAVQQSRSNAFGMPGYFTWGTTAQNGAAGALAALSSVAPGGPGAAGCRTAAGARDYMLGRNPYGSSLIVGFGSKAPQQPHHWGSVFGGGIPAGAVVGGPAPVDQIKSQGFPVKGSAKRFGSPFATYEDKRANYVTSEPAIDYSAASVLLLAAVEAHC